MQLFQNNAGFNISKSKLQYVEVNYSENDFALENIDEEYFSDFIDPSIKETKFVSILQSAFSSLTLRKPLKSSVVSFSLPYEFFKIISLPYDNTLIDADLNHFIEWEFSVLFPQLYASDFALRFIKIDDSSLLNKNKIIVYAIEKRILKILHKFATKNSLTIKFIDNVHLTGNLVIFSDPSFNKLQNSISIFINEESVNFIVLEGTSPIYVKSLNYNNISELIPKVSEGFNNINQIGIDSQLLHKAYIITDSVSENIIEQIRTQLNVNLLRINPFDRLNQNPIVKNNNLIQRKILTFSSALGVVLRLE
ncbi:MAG: hypothetical protein V1773_17515 [bacterium]